MTHEVCERNMKSMKYENINLTFMGLKCFSFGSTDRKSYHLYLTLRKIAI